jgi:hypothetical protein
LNPQCPEQLRQWRIERVTNHDVKAVEYWLKEFFPENYQSFRREWFKNKKPSKAETPEKLEQSEINLIKAIEDFPNIVKYPNKLSILV